MGRSMALTTCKDLKILLSLNGNNRLPHLEKEIFSSRELYTLYLCKLAETCDISVYDVEEIDDMCWVIYSYSKYVIHARWPEAESVILLNLRWGTWYRFIWGIDVEDR
jgi:hypothetical protein